MSRIRLNSEYRNKGAVRFREHLEQENTQEKESYLQAREEIKPLQDETWKLAEKIVINLKIKKMMTMIRTTKQLRNILISD